MLPYTNIKEMKKGFKLLCFFTKYSLTKQFFTEELESGPVNSGVQKAGLKCKREGGWCIPVHPVKSLIFLYQTNFWLSFE